MARARARARASNGLMCVKEGRPNVMLKENSERKIAAPGGTRTHNLLLSWQIIYLVTFLCTHNHNNYPLLCSQSYIII